MPSTRDVRIEVRLKARESRAWKAAARQSDLSLSEWIRHKCNGGTLPGLVPVAPVLKDEEPSSKKTRRSA